LESRFLSELSLDIYSIVDNDSWSKFYAENKGIPDNTTNVVVYKDLLIAVGQDGNQLVMASLNLESTIILERCSFDII